MIHARWCMLAIAGMLTTEILGIGNWLEVPLDVSTLFGVSNPCICVLRFGRLATFTVAHWS